MELEAAQAFGNGLKYIGAGLACTAMAGAGIGVGNVVGNYLAGALRNPAAAARNGSSWLNQPNRQGARNRTLPLYPFVSDMSRPTAQRWGLVGGHGTFYAARGDWPAWTGRRCSRRWPRPGRRWTRR